LVDDDTFSVAFAFRGAEAVVIGGRDTGAIARGAFAVVEANPASLTVAIGFGDALIIFQCAASFRNTYERVGAILYSTMYEADEHEDTKEQQPKASDIHWVRALFTGGLLRGCDVVLLAHEFVLCTWKAVDVVCLIFESCATVLFGDFFWELFLSTFSDLLTGCFCGSLFAICLAWFRRNVLGTFASTRCAAVFIFAGLRGLAVFIFSGVASVFASATQTFFFAGLASFANGVEDDTLSIFSLAFLFFLAGLATFAVFEGGGDTFKSLCVNATESVDFAGFLDATVTLCDQDTVATLIDTKTILFTLL
tara:strand:- start:511 stop:1434 length:924 start_codon:yes stop_codon:yes gene_type:complete